MLIHPWDEARNEEWCRLLEEHDFGQLIVPGRGRDYPVVVPTHFVFDGTDQVLLHLARPNPVWAALDESPHAVLSVVADYAYIEAAWNAGAELPAELGVPTSYYSAVQLQCTAEVVDDPVAKAEVLAAQLRHFERPGSARVTPSVDVESDRRQLPGIRAVRLTVRSVQAKMKYGGNKSPEHRRDVAARLRERGAPMDEGVRAQLLRRTPPESPSLT